ncbi:MAG: hypothetical protein ABII79_03410 [bacterium]
MKWSLSVVFAVGCFFGLWSPTTAQDVFEEEPGLFSTTELYKATMVTTQKKVVIRSANTLQGSLRVITTTDSKVSVSYRKKCRTSSSSQAIDFIDMIAIELNHKPEAVMLELRAPNPAPWSSHESGMVDAEVVVPENCVLEIDAAYFDLTANGPFEEVNVPSSMGKLEVRNVTARLYLKTVNGSVYLENISGEILVSTSNAPLAARQIVSNGQTARFINDGGNIGINDFSGQIDVKSSYGRIELSDFKLRTGRSSIRGKSGPITVDISEIDDARVMISNRFEDIEITVPVDLSARLSLAVEEGGKIDVGDFLFKADLVQPDRLNLVAGDGEALISASLSGKGNIYLRATE